MAAPSRRWSYSLRTLFVTLGVLAIPLGWVSYQLEWRRQRRQALQSGAVDLVRLMGFYPNPDPPWSLRLFGERPIWSYGLRVPESASDDDLRRARSLFPEFSVDRDPEWTTSK